MTDKHTKGPWSINSWPQAGSDIAIGAPGTPCIARVPLRDVSINEQRANAVLIAAADDMLKALKDATVHLIAAVSLLSRGGKKGAASDRMFDQMVADYTASAERARVVIGKATEQTPC